MEYKVGNEVDFYYDVYECVNNVDFEYDKTVKLHGVITEVDECHRRYRIFSEGNSYVIVEGDVVSRITQLKEKLNKQKLKIADMSLRFRNTFWDGFPKNKKRNQMEFDEAISKWYDAMSEYDLIESQLIMAGGEIE